MTFSLATDYTIDSTSINNSGHVILPDNTGKK